MWIERKRKGSATSLFVFFFFSSKQKLTGTKKNFQDNVTQFLCSISYLPVTLGLEEDYVSMILLSACFVKDGCRILLRDYVGGCVGPNFAKIKLAVMTFLLCSFYETEAWCHDRLCVCMIQLSGTWPPGIIVLCRDYLCSYELEEQMTLTAFYHQT